MIEQMSLLEATIPPKIPFGWKHGSARFLMYARLRDAWTYRQTDVGRWVSLPDLIPLVKTKAPQRAWDINEWFKSEDSLWRVDNRTRSWHGGTLSEYAFALFANSAEVEAFDRAKRMASSVAGRGQTSVRVEQECPHCEEEVVFRVPIEETAKVTCDGCGGVFRAWLAVEVRPVML